jgi:hypothetical protein
MVTIQNINGTTLKLLTNVTFGVNSIFMKYQYIILVATNGMTSGSWTLDELIH